MQFRNTNIPKKVQKIISKQQSFHKNRILIEIDQEEVNDVSGIKKQFQIQQQGLFQSVSPLNKIGKNEVKFKITSRNQIINSSNSVTRTENNWRVQKKEESNSKNSQIFQKRVPLKDKKENQYLAEGEAKRYNSVTKRYINYDSNTTNTSYNAFNKVQNQNFKKYDSKTENDQQLSDEEEFTYMAGGVKIRVNTLSGNTRCERSQSLIKELPNKLSDINLNKVNFSGQKNNNHQIINQRKILTDQLISISPKHNYQVYMDSKYFGNNDGNQQQPKYKTEQNIIDHYSLNWEKNQNIEEKSQILNFLKNQKQNSKQNLNIQQVSSVLIVNQNQPQINSSVLKQQNMQLLKIENLHTSPTSRSKQNSFSNSTNSNSYLDQSQARYRLQINPNCTQLPNMRIPSSNRVQGSSQTRGTEQSSLGVMPQQQSNQLSFQNQPLNPQIYTNLNEYFCQTPSQKQREINNQTSRQNKHEVKGSNIVQLTPLQSKSNSNLENKEEISKSKNQKRDKNTLKDLICSYYETPKNITGNAQSVLSQYSPINNRQDALKKQINLEIEQKNSINQQAQCQNNLPLNELELKQLDQNFLKEGNQAKSPYKNGFMREFKDINKQQQEIKELDSNIQLNIPNLLAKKESHLLNNTFNLQIANQDEEKQSQLQQIQNTIWFSNNQIFGLIQDNQNNTINDYKQDEQNINTIQAKLDEQQKYANYSQINIQNTYDDKYKIDINRSFQRRENSIEKDKKNDYKKNQILSSEFLNKAVNNQDEYIKQNQEKSYLLTDNSAIFQKLQNNIRSSPSTPFRKVNNSRQRIYQNQRQILTEIQKGNPVLSYIQTQYNQTLLKDNKMPQGVSNDKVSQLRKISLLPKEKIERQIDSLNNLKASSSERSQERQQYKNNNNNPYLQKSDFLKQVKKKQDKNKIIGQLLNLSEYSNLEGYSQLNTFKENSCQQNSIESTKRKNKNQCENDQKEGISELQYKTNKQNCAQQEITKPNINCNLNKYEIQQKFQLEAIMNNQPNVVRI